MAVALSLAACVSYQPLPLVPADELDLLEQRTAERIAIDGVGTSTEWFPLAAEVDFEDGLTLDEALALALFYGPEVRSARAAERAAGAQVLQAGVLPNPELSVGPRIATDTDDLIFPAGLSWEVPWTRGAEVDLAQTALDERRLAVIEVELDALLAVRAAFIELTERRSAIAVLEARLATTERIANWVDALDRAGEIDAVTRHLARSERDRARADLERTHAAETTARRDLFARIGLLPNATVEPVCDSQTMLPALPETNRDALLRQPSLRAAEAAYAGAEAALKREIRRQYPRFAFGPDFEYDRDEPTIGVGVTLELPLFDRNRDAIDAATADRERAREDYRTALLRATHAEAAARDALGSAERLLAIHREGAMRDAAATERALDARLRAGTAGVLEVLDAQRALAEARLHMLELARDAAIARLRAAVVGGHALARPEPTEEERER